MKATKRCHEWTDAKDGQVCSICRATCKRNSDGKIVEYDRYGGRVRNDNGNDE